MSDNQFDLARARAETPGVGHVVHLNNAGAALMPRIVTDATMDFMRLESQVGAYEAAERSREKIEYAHEAIARLIHCDADELAILDSASRAWAMALHSLPLRAGDRIIISSMEYGSNYISLLHLSRRLGVSVEVLPAGADGLADLAELESRLDERVGLIALPHVPMHDGLVNPVAEVGTVARRHGIPFMVDACQSVGQLPVDVAAIGCDLLVGSGRKFLRGPRGVSFLYVRQEIAHRLTPAVLGLDGVEWLAGTYRIAPGARRFETWEMNCASRIGLGVAIGHALDWGVDHTWRRLRKLADGLRDDLTGIPGVRLEDRGRERCGIIALTFDGHDSHWVRAELQRAGINTWVCLDNAACLDMQARGLRDLLRISLHYYNSPDDLARFCSVLEETLTTGQPGRRARPAGVNACRPAGKPELLDDFMYLCAARIIGYGRSFADSPGAEMISVPTAPSIGAAVQAALAEDFQGRLLGPEDSGYHEARRAWNWLIDRYPLLIARCVGTADVVQAVKQARRHGVPVSVKGGGHSIPGHCVWNDGLMIDLSAMKGVWVDPVRRTALAQPGLTWAEFDRETQLHGLAVTGGQVSTTGVAGLTLGGGIGWLMRKCGLTCDNLLSAELVTAEGDLLRVSADDHSELFWGIRGGGGNFGIVTSFEFQLHPVGPDILAGTLVYSLDKAREALRSCRDVMRQAPDELTTCGVLLTVPDGHPDFPPNVWNRRVLTITVCYAGSIEEGEREIQALREAVPADVDMVGRTTYVALQRSLDPTAPPGQNYWERSEYLADLDDAAIDTILACFDAPDAVPGEVIVFERGGAVSRIAEDAMAFAHRDASYLLWIIAHWRPGEDGERFIAWTQRFAAAMRPYSSGGVYVNGLSDEGQDRVLAATDRRSTTGW